MKNICHAVEARACRKHDIKKKKICDPVKQPDCLPVSVVVTCTHLMRPSQAALVMPANSVSRHA